MENRVPLFAGRRILKKESLWDIRDYTYAGWQLYFADYTDGMLRGCKIRTQDGILTIGTGMLKCHEFIYLMQEEEQVSYHPLDKWQVLKAEFSQDHTNLDYWEYRVRFFLDTDARLAPNQIEMCRFYLREGSRLRDSYKDFSDMMTEYDTIRLIDATVAGVGEQTLHPALLLEFARSLWELEQKDQTDIGFCLLIWNGQGRVERRAVAAYLESKGNLAMEALLAADNQVMYEQLEKVIDPMGRTKKEKRGARRIIVD